MAFSVMRRGAATLFMAGAILAAFASFAARAEVAVPKLTGHVVDQTGTLERSQAQALESKLADFERARGSQVVVLLVPTLEGEAIEDFAGRVTDAWQLGRKGVDDGVLFVVAKQDRKLRIHTGRGVQGTLTDALSKRIVADIVAPHFRGGDFAGGIEAGVDAIEKAIEGENLPLPAERPAPRKVGSVSSYGDFVWLAFFLVPVAAMILRGILGRFFGAAATSGLTGLFAWMVFGSLFAGVIAAFAAFVYGLVSGVGGGLMRAGHPGAWIPGGGWGGGGFGGGGFGGGGGGGGGSFGGFGGGSSGGGGGGGRW